MNFIYAGDRPPPTEFTPTPNAWTAYCPATDEELVRLLVLVRRKIPQHVPLSDFEMAVLTAKKLRPDTKDDIEAYEQAKRNAPRLLLSFKCAFAFVHQLGRTETANRKYFASHWGERCLIWARQNFAPREPSDAFVFAAAVVQDVPYALRTDAWSSALGFAEYGGRRAGFAPVIIDAFGNIGHIKVELPWKSLLRGERKLREPETPPQLDRDPTSVSHKHRFDHPKLWSTLEPWEPAPITE